MIYRDTLISAVPENITMLREKVFRSDTCGTRSQKFIVAIILFIEWKASLLTLNVRGA